jgi:hypothetical protein
MSAPILDPPKRSEESSPKESYAHGARSATGLGQCQALNRMAAICHPKPSAALHHLGLFAAQGEDDSLMPRLTTEFPRPQSTTALS